MSRIALGWDFVMTKVNMAGICIDAGLGIGK